MIAVVFVILIIGGNCRNEAERRHEYGGANYRRTQRGSRGTALSLPRTNRIEPLGSLNKDIGHSLQADSPAFKLLVKTYLTTGTVMRPISFDEKGVNETYSYIVDDADRIELTCDATQHKLNKWISNKISTPIKSSYTSTLVIYPDVDDINQNSTCERDDSKKITVKLTTTNIAKIRQDAAIPIYLPKGANWHNASCYGHEPTNIYKFKPGNQVMIENFDAHMNGTIYYCISYKIQTKVLSGKNIQPNGPMYEREKTKYVFYLKSKRMNNPETEGARESSTQTKEENNNGNDSGPSAIAIVGGVLGSIIFILLGILMCVCYKIQQRRPDDGATQVVYAEIEERSPTAPLPPPRNQAPYAMIIGILTPKQPPQTKSPSDYTYSTAKCQLTRAENPYCVVE